MFVLSSGTLHRYGLNRIFEFAKELGFDGVEVVMNEVYDTCDKKYLQSLVETYNIPIVALELNHQKNTPAKVRAAISMAEDLEIPIVVIRVPYFTNFKFTNWFKTYLPKLQNKTKVKIAIENPPAGKNFIIPEYSMGAVAELKRFQNVCLDSSHLVSRKADLMRAYSSLKKHIAIIHLSNWHKNMEHWLLHEGILPIESFLTKLAKDGYQGPISLKLDLDNIGKDKLRTVLKNLQKSKEFYDTYFQEQEIKKD